MKNFTFTLKLNRSIYEHELDLLYEAGLDDALFGGETVQFDREASALIDAILSAIRQLETVSDLRVESVENQDVVSLPMVAELTGKTRQYIHMLAQGRRGPGKWPRPIDTKHSLWRLTDIAEWWQENQRGDAFDTERQHLLAAVNAALVARRENQYLSKQTGRQVAALVKQSV